MVLVDTSVWSLVLRRDEAQLNSQQRSLKNAFSELVGFHNVQLIGPIRQEVLSGIRHSAQFNRIRRELLPFDDEPLSTTDFEHAAQLCNRCLDVGLAGSNVDFLICSVALRRNWSVFTTDNDFAGYAEVLGLRLYTPSA